MARTAGQAVSELVFALLLGPAWATAVVGLARVPHGLYVIDIYAEAGPWVWTAIVANLAATVTLLHFSPRLSRLAYANLGALYLFVLAVPYLMGYFAYGRSDALTIIGSIGGVMRTGNVHPENLYPATAFVGADLGFATGLPANVVFWVLGLAASLLLALVLCLFIREAIPSGRPPMAYILAFVIYAAWLQSTGTPNFVFFAVAAAAVYCAVALPQAFAGRLFCMMLLGGAVVLGHPFVAVSLFVGFLFLVFFGHRGTRTDAILTGVFIGIVFAVWAFTNEGLVTAIQRNLDIFQTSATAPVAQEGAAKADRLRLDWADWTRFILLYLGRYLVPAAAVGFGFAAAPPRAWFRSQPAWAWTLLITGALVEAALLFNPIVTHKAIRVININYAILGLVPLAALGLVWVARGGPGGRAGSTFLCVLVLSTSVLGAFDSPATFLPNAEFGNEEVVASRWLLSERGEYSIHNPLGVFEYRTIGLHYDVLSKDNALRPTQAGLLADHFAEPPRDGRFPFYVAIPTNDVVRYTQLYDDLGRFTTADFAALEDSHRLSRVYDSLGFTAYFYSR
ncbi:MAG: hypothetical protein QOJ26_949 [Thermoplasmata archaeon]|nr:hypothetical protein [Thermoplasmata archaeon]